MQTPRAGWGVKARTQGRIGREVPAKQGPPSRQGWVLCAQCCHIWLEGHERPRPVERHFRRLHHSLFRQGPEQTGPWMMWLNLSLLQLPLFDWSWVILNIGIFLKLKHISQVNTRPNSYLSRVNFSGQSRQRFLPMVNNGFWEAKPVDISPNKPCLNLPGDSPPL